jgi:hypothetical protein
MGFGAGFTVPPSKLSDGTSNEAMAVFFFVFSNLRFTARLPFDAKWQECPNLNTVGAAHIMFRIWEPQTEFDGLAQVFRYLHSPQVFIYLLSICRELIDPIL